MKNYLMGVILLLLFASTACSTGGTAEMPLESPGTEEPVADAVSGATPEGEGWKITLIGVRSQDVYQSEIEGWLAETPGSRRDMTLERKGETNTYSGILLRDLIALVDDSSGGMPAVFQDELWREGYDLTLSAADGFSVTINTAEVSPEAILVVDSLDGEAVSPRIAGEISGQAWVRDLREIELSLSPVDLSNNDFVFEMEINGIHSSFTIPEMEAMDLYVEDWGSFTNSHGNTTEALWGGVRLVPLLSRSMELVPETAIRIIAMDGYEMNYSGEMLLDQTDGEWILAFREDGVYMPEDPGYIRLVKVGPLVPNITGHVSARMIKKIVTEGRRFRDFELTIVQQDLTEVFDRQTVQSGVVTNRDRVMYYDRRADAEVPYMGIALWRLLERPTGYRAVTIEAADGFAVTLDNSQVEGNDDVIVAMYTGENDELLDADQWPLRLVWDRNAPLVPEGIKSVRNISRIVLVY